MAPFVEINHGLEIHILISINEMEELRVRKEGKVMRMKRRLIYKILTCERGFFFRVHYKNSTNLFNLEKKES